MAGLPVALRVDNMRDFLSAAVSSAVSWKTLALLLALINLKNLPFFWHVSLLQFTCLIVRRSGCPILRPCHAIY